MKDDIANYLANDMLAKKIISGEDDPVVRELLKHAYAQVFIYSLKSDDLTEEAWQQKLPTSPFDMAFYIKVLKVLFKHKDILKQLLEGNTDIDEYLYW